MKEITVVAKDRIGLLADISETLFNNKINIDSLSVESSDRTAIIRLMLENHSKAKTVLESIGFKVIDTDALVIKLPDQPGELAKISRILADHKLAIESVFILNKEGNQTVIAIKVDNVDKAKKLLKEKKYL